MLNMTRRPGESVEIDGVCTVTVVNCRGKHVSLSFDAHKDVEIFRTEVQKQRRASRELVHFEYEGKGLWLGYVGPHALWSIRVDPQGRFSAKESERIRCGLLTQTTFHSLVAAKRAANLVEETITEKTKHDCV